MEKLQVEYVSKKDLKPYCNNAKIHTAEQVEQIKVHPRVWIQWLNSLCLCVIIMSERSALLWQLEKVKKSEVQ